MSADDDALYRHIVESSPDAVVVFDLEGRILWANDRMARLWGGEEHPRVPASMLDTLDEEGRRQFRDHLVELREHGPADSDVDVQFVDAAGHLRWHLVRERMLPPAEEGGGPRVLSRATDYTSRRELLDQLRRGREELAQTQRRARLARWWWDVERDELWASPELVELFALDHIDFPLTLAQTLDLMHPDDRDPVRVAVTSALQVGEGGRLEVQARFSRADGWWWTYGRAEVTAGPDGPVLVGTQQDVTEAKAAELALADQVNQNTFMQTVATAANEADGLEQLLTQARLLVLLHDDWDRARGYRVEADGSLTPYHVDEEDRLADESDPDLCAAELALAERALATGSTLWDDQRLSLAFPVRDKERIVVVVVVRSAPPLYRHAMIEAMVDHVAVQMGQVAERERIRLELAAARDAAMEGSRQKSEFLATMSHEIRTPLNGVIGLTDLLLRTSLTSEQHRLASGVQVASRALLGVINDILDFSKIEAGRLELETIDFELRAVLDQVAEIFGEQSRGRGIDLSIFCAADVPAQVAGDPTRLTQVLTNLVSNAIKFTETGSVSVEIGGQPLADGGTRLVVEVVDTGVGVPEERAHTLFEPFTQADASTTRRFGGTGLGLAISHEIVESMGGRLTYRPRPGGGSVFAFDVPLGPAQGPRLDPADDGARERLAGRRALVVDDTGHNRLIVAEQLRWWGMEAEVAASAEEGLALLEAAHAQGRTPDVVLLDMAMPLRDGLHLAADVRDRPELDDVMLVMLTSLSTLDASQVRAAGVDDCLVKPVVSSTLRRVLVDLLAAGEETTETPVVEAPSVRPGAARVLVVEDNLINQMVAVGLLTSLGHASDTVDDGLAALEAVERTSYDAVLMDVQMPRLDGYAATRELRRRGHRVPIIAMTAAAIEGERDRCLAAGMDDFVTKPVDPATLGAALERWMGPRPTADEPTHDSDGTHGEGASADGDLAGALPDLDDPVFADPVFEGLDLERLETLRDLDPDSTEYLDRAIANMLAGHADAFAEVVDAAARGDAEKLRQGAHKLAGGLLNLGADDVGQGLREVERAVVDDDLDRARALLPDLHGRLEHAATALRAYQATYTREGVGS